ncbi:MAG TPA: ABC transporter transmembrane domain-containing protein, partial [Chloroflexota bacterium]|nr:ABC transporter transmembrane domain-containing protein [Chloroflexota bacterium]
MIGEPRGLVAKSHFVVHCAPGTFAMRHLPQITTRLEKAYGIVVSLLGGPPETALPIQVWLDEPERESACPTIPPAREAIRAPYLPESPGEGLDRAVLLVLLARIAGHDRPLPPLFVEGLHGCLLQKLGGFAGDEEVLAKLRTARANHALPKPRALLAGPDEQAGNLYYLAAQSFIAYLLERHGSAPMARVLREVGQDGGAAMRRAYGRGPATLEKRWEKTLQGETPAGVVAFLGMTAPYLRPYKRQLAEVSLYLVISVAFGIGLARMQGVLLDKALIPHDTHALVVIMAILVAAFALVLVTSLRQNYLTANIAESVLRGIRARMYAHIQTLHAGFFETTYTGDIMSRMTSDMAVIRPPASVFLHRSVPPASIRGHAKGRWIVDGQVRPGGRAERGGAPAPSP